MTIFKALIVYHLVCEILLVLCGDNCPITVQLMLMHPCALLIILIEGGLRGVWTLLVEYSLFVATLFGVAQGVALNGFAAWGVVVTFPLVYLIWLKQ